MLKRPRGMRPLFFGSTEATQVASAGGPSGAGAVLRYGNQGGLGSVQYQEFHSNMSKQPQWKNNASWAYISSKPQVHKNLLRLAGFALSSAGAAVLSFPSWRCEVPGCLRGASPQVEWCYHLAKFYNRKTQMCGRPLLESLLQFLWVIWSLCPFSRSLKSVPF